LHFIFCALIPSEFGQVYTKAVGETVSKSVHPRENQKLSPRTLTIRSYTSARDTSPPHKNIGQTNQVRLSLHPQHICTNQSCFQSRTLSYADTEASTRRFSTPSQKPYTTVEGSQQNLVCSPPPHAPASSSTSASLSLLAKSPAVSASLLCPAKKSLGFRVCEEIMPRHEQISETTNISRISRPPIP
jgi:hypothetical protein